MNEPAWYQDSGCMIPLLMVGGFLGLCYLHEKESQTPIVFPRMVGRVEQPFFGPPSLVITAWHQHTGVLRNGRLRFDVKGTQVAGRGGEDSEEFSFESWEPNRDHAVTLRFPLSQVDTVSEITVTSSLQAKDVQGTTNTDAWVNGNWKSNQNVPP